ncbi:GNAT family N-acetyltransferase [Aetokthonos hydrillicola Thurmond2011]|uniref:GNAT family N-acetyltransferase n=1 Tax=Aetokthonos hydrillicola Thurmond2011 TaxID=2712845 RepID=A0AAP5MCT8_9CYAN|nr:GNAT family N-acetyltransferase [Aetokthonos hydrillicola]MBW4585246.1 GNAT family N-acetyltransferase [Aetokthonos hydrillicola CCALA 1050]MDR9899582.1 GNAT family N-acetyltransferase [Aetokthonos hydrillicola Thurmond2011]
MTMSSDLILRFAQPDDCSVLFDLIKALAEYEKLSDTVTGNVLALREHLFGSTKYIEAIVAENTNKVVGFALFFHNYSTYLTQPGIYVEDIFVLPEYRQMGIGKALLTKIAQIAVERNCGLLEWSVLDWNEPAQAFYRRMGASILDDWRICRVVGENLTALAGSNDKV